jgi:hypothetical protein
MYRIQRMKEKELLLLYPDNLGPSLLNSFSTSNSNTTVMKLILDILCIFVIESGCLACRSQQYGKFIPGVNHPEEDESSSI